MNDIHMTQSEAERYQRQVTLRGFGLDAQQKLKQSRVLCIGAGGLGSPAILYLAAAGVGTIGIVDDDVVDRSNLHRQVIHRDDRLGQPKTHSAKRAAEALNPDIAVIAYQERLTAANAADLFDQYDLILDGADNFPTRYLVNDAAFLTQTPCVHGAIFEFEGQVTVFTGEPTSPCYRCMFPTPPEPGTIPSCAEAGVLGILPGTIGTLMATEAIKVLTGIGTPLVGRLLRYDALSMSTYELAIQPDHDCALCGDHRTITEVTEIAWQCATADLSSEHNPQLNPEAAQRLATATYLQWRQQDRSHLLVDVREAIEVAAGAFPPSESHLHIPLGDIDQAWSHIVAQRQTPDQPIVMLCQGGVRSQKAAEILRGQGVAEVYDVIGGWNACRQHPMLTS